MTLIKNLLIFLLSFSLFSAYANWVGKWESKGSDVVIGLSSEPNNPQIAKNSLLVIGYSKKHDCKPVVSVLVIKGQNIGQPINQKTFKSKKNQLIVKKFVTLFIIVVLLGSCTTTYTPFKAANTGGKTCKKRHMIR